MIDLKRVFDAVVRDKVRTIPGKARLIETAKQRGRILALPGSFDYVQKVLPHCYAAVKVTHDPGQPPPTDLLSYDVVFIGCPGRVAAAQWGKPLTAFVEAGGVLLTTDWCLENLIEHVFPKTVRKKGTAQGQFPLRLRLPKHPLLEGMDAHAGTPWVVEGMSSRIEVIDPKRVEVLLDAPAMGEPSAVLVAFPVGKGLVVHAISHFHLQGSDETGEYVSAYLLTNVIDEAVRRRHLEAAPRIRVVGGEPLRIRVVGQK